jgi:hypothetical protein
MTYAARLLDTLQRYLALRSLRAGEPRMVRDKRMVDAWLRAEGFEPNTAPRELVQRAYRAVRGNT